MDRIPITPDGIKNLKAELSRLKAEARPQILVELEAARAHGDLSENAEYHAAKERLAFINGRMQELEVVISKVEVIDPTQLIGETKVRFGAHVTIVDVDSEEKSVYQIVGEHESDVEKGRISIKSPIARALIGKGEEEQVKVKTPKGEREFEIMRVQYK